MDSSISISETNKIRASLGLSLLPEPSNQSSEQQEAVSVEPDEDSVAQSNFDAHLKANRDERQTADLKLALDKKRNQLALNTRLKGSTLADGETISAKQFAKTMSSRKATAAERVRKQETEFEKLSRAEREALKYDVNDLSGLKVGHELDVFDDGEERIMTLKDSRVLDEEDDELLNVDLAVADKDKKTSELKKGPKKYSGKEDIAGTILSQYDDEEDESQIGFRLGGPVERKKNKATPKLPAHRQDVELSSIDYAKNVEIQDYATEDVGFKKVKKSKKKKTREREVEDIPVTMDIEQPTTSRIIPVHDGNYIDDEELQTSLAKQRSKMIRQQRKRHIQTPEEMALALVQDAAEQAKIDREREAVRNGEQGGLILDDTSAFLSSMENKQRENDDAEARRRTYDEKEMAMATIAKPDSPGIKEEDAPPPPEKIEAEEGEILYEPDKTESVDEDMEQGPPEETKVKIETAEELLGLRSKAQAGPSRGLGDMLRNLKQSGQIKPMTAEQREREENQKAKNLWLLEVKKAEARGEAAPNYNDGQDTARDILKSYEHYRPNVELKYYDEFGNTQDTKETWKSLSHRFHGKTTGHLKTQKRMMHLEQKKRQESMLNGDTATGMKAAFESRAAKTGQAHMVLSVGSKGAAPQATDEDILLLKKPKPKYVPRIRSESVAGEGSTTLVPDGAMSVTSAGNDTLTSSSTPNVSSLTIAAPKSAFTKITHGGFVPVLASAQPSSNQFNSEAAPHTGMQHSDFAPVKRRLEPSHLKLEVLGEEKEKRRRKR